MTVTVKLLGHPRVSLDGAWQDAPQEKPFWLLAYLTCAEAWVEREKLSFLFWPDVEEKRARVNLRQLIKRARKYPFAKNLRAEVRALRWPVESDVDTFRQALGSGNWAEAVRIYGGELLTGVSMGGDASLQAWLELERGSLQNAWRNAAMKRAEQLEGEAAHPQAAELLKRLLETDALAEDVLQHYLKNAYLAGQRDRALHAYGQFVANLNKELDLSPLEETVQLATIIQRTTQLVLRRPAKAKATVPLSVLRPPRLVGRDDVLQDIAQLTSGVVLIAGEAGIGKSRLLVELAPEALFLRCREGLERVPYQPVAALIRSRLPDQDTLRSLGPYLEDLARLVPEAAPDVTPAPSDTQTSKTRLLEALARYLEAMPPTEQSFRLVFDDLQWADSATLELLVYLTNRKSVRILGAYRDNEMDADLKDTLDSLNRQLSTLTLKPLPAHEVKNLLAELMGGLEGPARFSRWLHQSTGGNPMFTLEALKSLFESGVLRADETNWHSSIDDLTQDYRELEVPAVIAEVIARRVARLPGATVRVVQAAAVMRNGFTPRGLGQIVGLSDWAVMEALEEAEGAGLVQGDGFRHDLLRQSVYRALPETRRKLLHGKVARVLSEMAATVEPVVVAEHWLLSGAPERAVGLWLQAADALDALALIAEANGLLERAARYARDAKERTAIEVRLAASYREAGRYAESQALLEEASKAMLDPRTTADALIEQGYLHLNLTRLDEAAAVAAEAEAIVLDLGDPSLELDLAKLRSNIAFREGRYEASCAVLEPVVARLRKEPPGRDLAGLLTSIGAAYDGLGRLDDALPFHRESLSIAQAIGSHYYQVDAASNLLHCLRRLGRAEEGLAAAEAALQLGQYQGSDYLRNSLVLAYASLGRRGDATVLDEHLAHKSENPLLGILAWTRLARVFYDTDRKLEASRALDEAIGRLPAVEVAFAQAGVVILALHCGDSRQKASVKLYIQRLLDGTLADELRQELEQALSRST